MTSKNLLASAPTRAELEKCINRYFFSEFYIITDDLRIYNTKLEEYLNGYTVTVKRGRYRFERAKENLV